MAELERVTQSKCLKAARSCGSYAYKNPQNEYTEVGRPDLTLCVPIKVSQLMKMFGDTEIGIYIGVEVKRPGRLKGLSEPQKIVGRQIEKCHGIWLAIDNEHDLENIIKNLQGGNNVIQRISDKS